MAGKKEGGPGGEDVSPAGLSPWALGFPCVPAFGMWFLTIRTFQRTKR